MDITDFKNKKMKLLTTERQKSYENAKSCYICHEKFEDKNAKDKSNHKVRDYCHYTGEYRSAAHSICNLRHSVPKEIPIVFPNGSNYDYHFIIKKFVEEFKEKCTCFGENTEKYIIIAVPIEKEVTRTDKNGKETVKTISYRL